MIILADGGIVMNISLYQSLINVAKFESITYAAQQANISQPALSQQIRSLEEEMDVQLFNRSPRGVTLTDQGKVFVEYAQQIVDTHHEMIHAMQTPSCSTLTIYSTPIINSYALPCTLFHVSQNFDNYSLNLETFPSDTVEKAIANGRAHIGFIVGESQHPELISIPAFKDPYYLATSYDSNLPETLDIDELANYPLLMLANSQKSRLLLNQYLNTIGVNIDSLKIPYDMDSIESIKTSITRGYGLAFLPYMVIKKELYNKQLRIVRLKGFDYQCQYSLIRTKRRCYGNEDIIDFITYKLNETKC